jgi:hypothetical protein
LEGQPERMRGANDSSRPSLTANPATAYAVFLPLTLCFLLLLPYQLGQTTLLSRCGILVDDVLPARAVQELYRLGVSRFRFGTCG